MKDFLIQYSAVRFALDRQDRRRRGQHGVVASLLLAFGYILVIAILLPVVLLQLLATAGIDPRRAMSNHAHRGVFFDGRPSSPRQTDGS